jgi:pimeloyl-ACP methyl ester carboxylesterase
MSAGGAPSILETDTGARIAYHRVDGATPTVVFLGGFASDMTGDKALFLERHCAARGQAFVRLDYQGHGASSGCFEDGTIGAWAGDARAVVEAVTTGPLVLVGSSMGGWVMLIVARALADRVGGLVGIASAPDFTEDLMRTRLLAEHAEALARDGQVRLPSAYDPDGYVVTGHLLEEARAHLQLRAPVPLRCPVRLVHGMADPDVPWQTSLGLVECLDSSDVRLTLVKDAGHRLSEPRQLALIASTLDELLETIAIGAG